MILQLSRFDRHKAIERNKALHVDLTEEYAVIKEKSKQKGYASISEFVRVMLLDD